MTDQPTPPQPATTLRAVAWNSEATNPVWMPLTGDDVAWMAAHPGEPLKGALATATPESDQAMLKPLFDNPDDAADTEAYFAETTPEFEQVHGPAAQPEIDVHGMTVWDAGLLVHNGQGWVLAEIDADIPVIQALRQDLAGRDDVRVIGTGTGPVGNQPDLIAVALSPAVGRITALADILRGTPTLTGTAVEGFDPVEYLVQPGDSGSKARVYAVDSNGTDRVLRAVLTAPDTVSAYETCQWLNGAINTDMVDATDALAAMSDYLSEGSLSALKTELERLGTSLP